jgi:hypothetical protein
MSLLFALPTQPSSLRKQGPITTGGNNFYSLLVVFLFQQHLPRSMGPCFRRDDDEIQIDPRTSDAVSKAGFLQAAGRKMRGECYKAA